VSLDSVELAWLPRASEVIPCSRFSEVGSAGVGSTPESSRPTGLGVGEHTGEESSEGRSRVGARLARLLSSVCFSWLGLDFIQPGASVFSSAELCCALRGARSCVGLAGCDQLRCVGLSGDWEGLHGAERGVLTTWLLNVRVGLQ